jgi:hypothetical protein
LGLPVDKWQGSMGNPDTSIGRSRCRQRISTDLSFLSTPLSLSCLHITLIAGSATSMLTLQGCSRIVGGARHTQPHPGAGTSPTGPCVADPLKGLYILLQV